MIVAQPTTQLNATEQDTLVKQIGLALLRAAPRDWRKVTAEYRAVGRYHEMTGEIITEDGTAHEWVATHDIATLFGRLRAGMYRDGRGTWFNARYQLDHPSSYNLEYNRDEPQWRLAPPPQAYSDELRMFPRSEENVPEWLIRRMSGLGPEQPGPHFRIARIFDTIGPAGRPVINRPDLEIEEQDRLLEYLDHAPLVVTERGYDIDRLAQTPEATVPVAFHSDGQWIWPAAVNFYLREYGVSPEIDLIDHVRQNGFTLPDVDDTTLQAAAGYLTRGNQPPQQRPNGPGGPGGPPPQGPPQNGPVPPQQAPVNQGAPGQPGPNGPAGPGAPGPSQAAQPPVPPAHQQGQDAGSMAAAAAAPVAAAAAVPAVESTLPNQAEQAQRYEEDYDTQDHQAQDFHEAAAEQQYADGYDEQYPHEEAQFHESEQDVYADEARQDEEPHQRAEPEQEPQAPHQRPLADPEATTYARPVQGDSYAQQHEDTRPEDASYDQDDTETTAGYTAVEQADADSLPLLTHDAEAPNVPPPSDSEVTQVDAPPQEQPAPVAAAHLPRPEPEPRREEAPRRAAPEPQEHRRPRRAEHPVPVLNELQSKFDELDVADDVYRIGSPAEHGWSVEQVDGGGWRVGWYDGKLTNPAVFGDAEDAAAFMLGKVLLNPNGAPPPAEQSFDERSAAEEPPAEKPPTPAPPVLATLSPEVATGSHPVPPRESIPAQEQTAFTTAEELLGDDLDDEPAPAPVPPAPPVRPNPTLSSPPPAPPRREPPVTPPPPPMRREEPARPPAAAANAGQPDAKQNWPISPLSGEPPLTLFRGKELRELPAGSELDRFGGPNGNLTYAAGTPFEERSLVPEWVNRPYHVYRVQRPLEALAGVAIPWFNQPGGGSAYLLPASIEELLAEGDLIELDPGEPPID
ncbi:TNT domain-containing protein [Amycolatopsis regifaucium]|uniref:TNT domain-containing protein n=1 Tax=Amycolatopsis regifaucium TaxID=546365 RepID=A0A154MD49_9PSEU|nr:TNT domain-containing protein [Amycolatopsis regifaucium]KZB82163.1 hypothetical protein AVL48_09515 [Amycolatopsis regifaucium]OKA05765.1 hypothetical protein ATP06_0221475 [Amycolatopsis regifaucium]